MEIIGILVGLCVFFFFFGILMMIVGIFIEAMMPDKMKWEAQEHERQRKAAHLRKMRAKQKK